MNCGITAKSGARGYVPQGTGKELPMRLVCWDRERDFLLRFLPGAVNANITQVRDSTKMKQNIQK